MQDQVQQMTSSTTAQIGFSRYAKPLIWGLCAAVVLSISACSSTKLTDKNGAPIGGVAADAASQGGENAIANVNTAGNMGAGGLQGGPGNVEKIIYFDFDSFSVAPQYQNMLSAHANFLARGGSGVRIEGHTDERGSREYNLALGQKRSDAVASSLRLLGVQPTQIESVSYGEENPAQPGTSETAFAKNRRAVINYR